MKKILSVSVDTITLDIISDLLRKHEHATDFNILTAESLQKSDTILEETKIDIVIIDLSDPSPSDLESLTTITKNNGDIPFIVMTVFETSEIESTIKSIDAIRYFEKPVDFKALAAQMVQEMTGVRVGGVGGVFHGISLPSFLQMSEMERTSCTLKIKAKKQKEGRLYMQDGVLVGAVTETASGEEAVYEILDWDSPTIEIEAPDPDIARDIEKPLMNLLMESARRQDEKAGKSVHKSGKVVYKPVKADTEKKKVAGEKKKAAAGNKDAAAEKEKIVAGKKQAAVKKEKAAATPETLESPPAEPAEKAGAESEKVSVADEPRKTEEANSWWESRSIRYSIVGGISGFICLGLLAFFMLNSGERSPGGKIVQPLPSGTAGTVRGKVPPPAGKTDNTDKTGNAGAVKSISQTKSAGIVENAGTSVSSSGNANTSAKNRSYLVDLVLKPLSYLSPEYVTKLLNDAIEQGDFEITTKITPLLPPELWRKIMEKAMPSDVGNILIHYPPEMLLVFLDKFDKAQFTMVMEKMSSRMTTDEVGKLFNLSNPEELAKITANYSPARLIQISDKMDERTVLRLIESISNKITADQVIRLMDATGPMYLAEIALHFPPEPAAKVLAKMNGRQTQKLVAQIKARITSAQIVQLMETADSEYIAAVVPSCPWEAIDAVLTKAPSDYIARMTLNFPARLGIRTLNKLSGAQARTLAAHIGRSWTSKQITLSGADADYVAMIVFDSPLEVISVVRHKLDDAQLQALIKIASRKMGSGDPRAMEILSQLVR